MPARHPLSDAVATTLPGPSATRLIKGCLDRDDAGRRALKAWISGQQDPIAALTAAPVKWLLPLVFRACEHHRLDAPGALVTVLKTAVLREELRTASFQAIRGRVLRALADAGVYPIVLKGASLGELVYPHASLRHAHDVELLVSASEWDRIGDAIEPLGFAGTDAISDVVRPELKHASGLPLVLHRRLFTIPFHNDAPDDFWLRTEMATLAGAPARVLSPADALVHALGYGPHAAGRDSYRWIVDAWYLLDRRHDVDWDVVARTAAARHMALPLALSLRYLAHHLDALVPRAAYEGLTTIASKDRSVGPELALHAALAGAGGLRPLLRQTPTKRGRAAILRHRLLPSVAFLSWATQPHSPWLRATHAQVFRVVRHVARRASDAVSLVRQRSKRRVQT